MTGFDLKNVDVFDMLEALDMKNVQEATFEEVLFSCPFPGHTRGDEKPSAYMNKESTAWFCHGCKRGGNAITFLADLESISQLQATKFLRERYGGEFREPTEGLVKEIDDFFAVKGKPDHRLITLDENLKDRFRVDWRAAYQNLGREDNYLDPILQYMPGRGFKWQTLKLFEVGFDAWSQRFTIPIFDEHGRLVGFKGRSWSDDNPPKYKVLGDREGKEPYYGFGTYSPSLVIYGLDKVPEGIRHLIVVEGELNVLAMHQMGFTNTVGIGGSNFTKTHAQIIRKNADSVTLFFDSITEKDGELVQDKAGGEATIQASRWLEPHMPVWTVPDHIGDPGDIIKNTPREEDQIAAVNEILSDQASTLVAVVE